MPSVLVYILRNIRIRGDKNKMENRGYYLFWSIVALIFTVVMTASVVGLQYWLSSQKTSCPAPQATTLTVEEIPITIELHEPPTRPFHASQITKWIDPDNQTIHYIYPEEYSSRIMPMYTTVPPIWYQNMLTAYMNLHGDEMPQEIIDAIPWEWKQAVMPNPRYDSHNALPKGSN